MKKKFFLPIYANGNTAPVLQFGRAHPWLAPLAGYSDLPFRLLCREMGASVCVTEMISAKGLLYCSPGTGELLANTAADKPLVVQLFGAEPTDMANAVTVLGNAGYPYYDVNLGCSVPKVMRQGAGSALLGTPEKCLEIAQAMFLAAREIGIKCKIGFKMRLGKTPQTRVLPDLALRLEDLGAAWICLHPRYANQGFTGNAAWSEFERLATRLSIPLIASGDMFCAGDGIRCLKETGATTIMYARGALRNPAIFRNHLRLLEEKKTSPLDNRELGRIIRRHVELIAAHASEEKAIFGLKFIVPRYVKDSPKARLIRNRLCGCGSMEDFEEIMQEFFR